MSAPFKAHWPCADAEARACTAFVSAGALRERVSVFLLRLHNFHILHTWKYFKFRLLNFINFSMIACKFRLILLIFVDNYVNFFSKSCN